MHVCKNGHEWVSMAVEKWIREKSEKISKSGKCCCPICGLVLRKKKEEKK